jgi:hypothetical protein
MFFEWQCCPSDSVVRVAVLFEWQCSSSGSVVPVTLDDGAVAVLGNDASPEGVSVAFPSVSVVIPALNEERNIPHVFERIPADVHQVVLVDGRSVDGSRRRRAT